MTIAFEALCSIKKIYVYYIIALDFNEFRKNSNFKRFF